MQNEEQRQRLIEASALLLEAAGGSLPITSLNKALFYLDLHALLATGQTATGTTYVALPAGPVVAKYDKRVIRALEDAGLAQQDEQNEDGTKPLFLTGTPERKLLSKEHAELVQMVAKWAAEKKPSELSKYSHDNIGWKAAWDAGLGARKPAVPINLRLAMQQIAEEDPWVSEEPAGDVAAAFTAADAESGSAW